MGNVVDPDTILVIAADAGRLMLESGGETYRTEDTMVAAAAALGASDCEAFVTPTVVLLGFIDSLGHHHSCMHRVTSHCVNLGRIANINKLTRRLTSSDSHRDANPRMIVAVLNRIRNSVLYKKPFVVAATALSCFFFALIFDGFLCDALTAAFSGALLRLVMFQLEKSGCNQFIQSLLGGVHISLSCGICTVVWPSETSGIAVISVLMILVPGLAIVNAIRDIIAGDLVAGSARAVETFVIAAGLSIGVAGGMMIFSKIMELVV